MSKIFKIFAAIVWMTAAFSMAGYSAIPAVAEMNNKICPVSGDDVSGEHFAEHHGKRFGFCCGQCLKKFNRDPEKYISGMDLKEAPAVDAADIHRGHHHDHD